MNLILIDFLRRWRWPLLGYAIFTVLMDSMMLFNIAPLGICFLSIESKSGSLRAIRIQPVSRRTQARIWWFISVLMPTLITLPLLITGMALRQSRYAPRPIPGVESPWFAVAVVLWVGLGLSALFFLLDSIQFSHQENIKTRRGWGILKASPLPLLAPVCILLPMLQPLAPVAMRPWHWAIIGLIPLLMMASYVAAPGISYWRKRPMAKGTEFSLPWTNPNEGSGSTGLFLLLKALHGRVLGVMLTVALVSCVLYPWVTSRQGNAEFMHQSVMQLLAIALVFSAVVSDQISLRMLRCMPLSTRHLSLCLLSVPMLQGLIMAPFMVWQAGMFSGLYPLWLDAVALAVFIGGLGAFMLTFMCHFTSPWRWVIGILPLILIPFEFLESERLFPWLLPLGTVLLVGALLWLQRGFWRSAAYYKPRRVLGRSEEGSLHAS